MVGNGNRVVKHPSTTPYNTSIIDLYLLFHISRAHSLAAVCTESGDVRSVHTQQRTVHNVGMFV